MKCPCRKPAVKRGVCSYCYFKYAKLVRLGIATWAQLESEGKVNPPRKPTGLPRDKTGPTVFESIYRAACQLTEEGFATFTKEDLCIRAWKLNPRGIGLKNYEHVAPNANIVFSRLTARDLQPGGGCYFLEWVSPSVYRLRPGIEPRDYRGWREVRDVKAPEPTTPLPVDEPIDPEWEAKMIEKVPDSPEARAALKALWRRVKRMRKLTTDFEWRDGKWE